MAIPALFVGLIVVRLPEARTTPRRIARLFVAVLLLTLATSQLFEGVGAFGSGKGTADKVLELMHGLGEGGTLFSIFALPLSFVIVAVVYTGAAVGALIARSSSGKRA